MKLYIKEGIAENGKFNAGSKAREDVEKILKINDYKALEIRTQYGVRQKKWQKPLQYLAYLKNYFEWKKAIKSLDNEDTVYIQYPIVNITLFFNRVIVKLAKKNVKTIAIIHDLDSLRIEKNKGNILFNLRRKYEDTKNLKKFYGIISHNKHMTEKIKEMEINKCKIVELGIFDYLANENIALKEKNKNMPVVIAGNLSSEKAGYIGELGKIKNIEFNLYGKGIEKNKIRNINYKGSFLPDDLPSNIEGSFGLVWDGNKIDTCDGVYGNYLRYNNPHKVSLYIISRMPVIVWNKSAVADFVIDNNIGFSVGSLEEIPGKLKELTEDDYESMIKNVDSIRKKISNGEFLLNSIEEMERI